MNWFLVKSYFKYFFRSKHRKGYGLHSPFVFNLVREVIYGPKSYYDLEEINRFRKQLKQSNKTLEVKDFGAGSKVFKTKNRSLKDLEQSSSIPHKYGTALFLLVNYFKPQTILELGTSIGISGAYLTSPCKKSILHTIEGCEQTAKTATDTFKHLGCINVKQHIGTFKEELPKVLESIEQVDFVFFDGEHTKEATLDYFEKCHKKSHNDSIFVFDDIHWSEEMNQAWQHICEDKAVTVSIDLFQLGIVFFRKECKKQHFTVHY